MIGIKDILKMVGIMIMTACAIWVATIFLNFNIDLDKVRDLITTDAAKQMYDAQKMTSIVVIACSCGCLSITTLIMLFFYIKIFIDNHRSELGILKALGYSNISIAKKFAVFGVSVFIGCTIGYLLGLAIMDYYYHVQLDGGVLPQFSPSFNWQLPVILIIAPSILFAIFSVVYACLKLKKPALDLIKGTQKHKIKKHKKEKDQPFLKQMKMSALKEKKSLPFFVAFGVFCFSSMIQMGSSMDKLASPLMKWMIIGIGIVLSSTTLILALTTLVKNQKKNIGMMRIFGYPMNVCRRTVLDTYRIVAYIGFAIGTAYQYGLIKIMVSVVFSKIDNVPEYHFDYVMFLITLGVFIVVYELLIRFFASRLKNMPIKEIMLESI